MTAVERLLAVAAGEIGYLEKKSNAQLDDKTANAGSNNYTKYARDLDAISGFYNGKKQGCAWCDMFVDWCFVTAFGVETALRMTGQKMGGLGAGCTYSASYYKAVGRWFTSAPQVGDQIFFTKDGGKTSNHTGIVVKADGSRVYTIEGNTSSAAGVVANGGAVAEKSYLLTYKNIYGYGRPDWSLVKEEWDMTKDEVIKLVETTVDEAIVPLDKALTQAIQMLAPKTYHKVAELPEWARADIQTLADKGVLQGDETGNLELSLDMVRLLVIMARLNRKEKVGGEGE